MNEICIRKQSSTQPLPPRDRLFNINCIMFGHYAIES